MNIQTHARYKARSEVLKALGHPTRLFIIDEISKRERSVLELTKMVEADISTVSKHLSVLKNAGIVRVEKRGTQVFYSLKAPCLVQFFPCIEAVIKANADEMASCLAQGDRASNI